MWADEAPFGFIKTTDIDPKGGMQLTDSLTYRFQKLTDNGGYFDLLIEEAEFEYGITDNFQLGFACKWDWTQAYHNGPHGATTPPEPFLYDVPNADAHYDSNKFVSFSFDAVYRLLSPYTDSLGLALNFEPEMSPYFGPGFFAEPTFRVILQKNFLDDMLVTAFNFTYAPELRLLPANYGGDSAPTTMTEETDVNYYFGLSYRFIPNWSVGFEVLHEQEFNNYNFTDQSNGGTYLGPTVHYADEKFFFTLLFLQQMPWAVPHDGDDTVPGALVNGVIYDNDFELYRLKFIAGIDL